MKTMIAILVGLIGLQANSQQLTAGSFDIVPGQRQVLPVSNLRLTHIYVQAQCFGSGNAPMEIQINGKKESNITVPCHDPNYQIPVRASVVREIAFINNSTINRIRIFSVQGSNDGSGTASRPSFGGNYNSASQEGVAQLAEDAVRAANALKRLTEHDAIGRYILPLRRSAAELRAKVTAWSVTGQTVKLAMADLHQKIVIAAPLLERFLETDAAYDSFYSEDVTGVQSLLSIKERLQAMSQ